MRFLKRKKKEIEYEIWFDCPLLRLFICFLVNVHFKNMIIWYQVLWHQPLHTCLLMNDTFLVLTFSQVFSFNKFLLIYKPSMTLWSNFFLEMRSTLSLKGLKFIIFDLNDDVTHDSGIGLQYKHRHLNRPWPSSYHFDNMFGIFINWWPIIWRSYKR